MEKYKHKELTDKIIQAFYCVYNELGYYLKSTDIEVGLLLNFGMKPEIRRKAFDNDRKKICANPLNLRHLRAKKK